MPIIGAQRLRGSGRFPFTPMPRMGRKPRWSREHVLQVINRTTPQRSR